MLKTTLLVCTLYIYIYMKNDMIKFNMDTSKLFTNKNLPVPFCIMTISSEQISYPLFEIVLFPYLPLDLNSASVLCHDHRLLTK
jgi:hypothetical protein